MPHKCVHCSAIYPDASKELLEGCKCGSHFFFYLNEEQIEKLKTSQKDINISELTNEEKNKIETDVREIMKINDEETPVILDLESIRILGPGKFEVDLTNLFSKNRPLIYKLDEGKYIIDLASTLNMKPKDL